MQAQEQMVIQVEKHAVNLQWAFYDSYLQSRERVNAGNRFIYIFSLRDQVAFNHLSASVDVNIFPYLRYSEWLAPVA